MTAPSSLGAQQRHGGDRDQAGLHRGQPDQRHGGRVAAAQQHAVARYQAQFHRERVGDAVHLGLRLRVAQRALVAAEQRSVGVAGLGGAIEQGLHRVDLRGQLQLGAVEAQLGPLIGRWQAVVHEVVGLRAGDEACGHGGGRGGQARSAALPRMSSCTSLAPS
jgi:hypothetical protein